MDISWIENLFDPLMFQNYIQKLQYIINRFLFNLTDIWFFQLVL